MEVNQNELKSWRSRPERGFIYIDFSKNGAVTFESIRLGLSRLIKLCIATNRISLKNSA